MTNLTTTSPNSWYIYDKNILVFNSGGGSGFEKMVEASKRGDLQANIAALITDNLNNWCVEKAKRLGIKCYLMEKDFSARHYQQIVDEVQKELWKTIDLFALSGRLKFVRGLDPAKTINIHPWPLYPWTNYHFGGKGMHGHYVHEAVVAARKRWEITHSEVTMHFTNDDEYDGGSVFFRRPVSIFPEDTADILARRVNDAEHQRQRRATNKVVNGEIALKDNKLILPEGYEHHKSKVFPPQVAYA